MLASDFTEKLAEEIALRLVACRIDDDVLRVARALRGAVNGSIRRHVDEYLVNIQRRFPDLAERVGFHKADLIDREARLFDMLFAGDFGPDYVRAVQESVMVEAAAGLGARVRSSVGLRLCSMLFSEIAGRRRFSARAAVDECDAVLRLLFMDLFTAISLDQQLTRKAVKERQDAIERSASAFLAGMARARKTMEEAARTTLVAAETTQSLTERAKQETLRNEASCAAGSVHLQGMAEGARIMSVSMTDITDRSGQSLMTLHKASQDARAAEQSMRDLAESAHKIGSIIDLISTISSQTNLLALNATIEAARAGAAGRGFAVVASEVKLLSAQTGLAASEIGKQISQIQAATHECVSKIGSIARTMGEITSLADSIVTAVTEQSRIAADIAGQTDEFSSTSAEILDGAKLITRALDDTQAASGDLGAAAQALAKLSMGIDKDVYRFMESMRAA